MTRITLAPAAGRLARALAPELRSEDGQTMAEYALLLTLIVVVTAVVIATLGSSISSVFNTVVGGI